MKSMNGNGNCNNWLGFSLSSHINMEVTASQHPHHHAQMTTSAVPSSFLLAPHTNDSSVCYGTENSGHYPHLSAMPLKSDGSLCIMEAFTRSRQEVPSGMVPTTSPKLEDFLGGATMGAHQYGNGDGETMALSLDSIYYQQNPDSDQTNRHQYLDLFQPFRQHIQVQQNHYFSGIGRHGIYDAPLEGENRQSHVGHPIQNLPQIQEESWSGRQYHTSSVEMDQKIENCLVANGGGSTAVGAMGYGDLRSLSLSMSPGSQSSCITAPQQLPGACVALVTKKKGGGKFSQKQSVHRKSIDTFGQRTSQYRGVTRHRWTGRYEAHLWDNSCKKEGQARKGRQVYLGGYDMEEKAARAYDLAALKYWGPSTHINFPLESYQQQLEEMRNMSRQEYVAHLRRKSSGFSRGASMYRGVTRHHQHGRWQARIGRVAGNKDLYLGTFSTQEEAAEAYDIAAIKFRGVNAVTNFDISRYDVERIMASNTLLAGELAKRQKEVTASDQPSPKNKSCERIEYCEESLDWKMVLCQAPSSQQQSSAADDSLRHEKATGETDYRTSSFPAPSRHGMVGIVTINSSEVMNDSAKVGMTHVSNPSSLVTSLSSSREGSPDKNSNIISMVFSKGDPSKYAAVSTPLSNPSSTAQLRHSISSMAHIPAFAAWTDA